MNGELYKSYSTVFAFTFTRKTLYKEDLERDPSKAAFVLLMTSSIANNTNYSPFPVGGISEKHFRFLLI